METISSPGSIKNPTRIQIWIQKNYLLWLLFPTLLFLLLVQVYPSLYTIVLSFNRLRGGKFIFVGLQNYAHLLASSDFLGALQNTGVFWLSYMTLTVVLAMIVALLLNRRTFLTPIYTVIIFIPWILSDVVSATMWRWMFQESYGIVQVYLIDQVLKGVSMLSSDAGSMVIVILASVWRTLAFTALLFLGALQTVPSEVSEAAALDGASGWQAFWRVTVPIIRPTLLVAILLTSIRAINALGLILATTNGGPGTATTTASVMLYREAFQYGDFGEAAALAVILFLVNLGLTLIYFRFVKTE